MCLTLRQEWHHAADDAKVTKGVCAFGAVLCAGGSASKGHEHSQVRSFDPQFVEKAEGETWQRQLSSPQNPLLVS